MTLNGVIFDMKLDLDSHRRLRGIALRNGLTIEAKILSARIEEIKHYLKLLEKVERDGGASEI